MNTITNEKQVQDLRARLCRCAQGITLGAEGMGWSVDHAVILEAADALAIQAAKVAELQARIAELEARIDALMLEHCPDEMTPEQVAEWAKHQKPAEEAAQPARVAELEAAERQRNVFAQQANEYAEEARALRARIAELEVAQPCCGNWSSCTVPCVPRADHWQSEAHRIAELEVAYPKMPAGSTLREAFDRWWDVDHDWGGSLQAACMSAFKAGAAQPAQAPLSEQDAGLLNQAHELLECYSAEMRLRGNDSAANGAECSADAILRLFKLVEPAQAASLADIDVPTTFKLAGESDEQWIDRITGGKPAQVVAPEQADGWQLVPVEATPEMMKAAVVSLNGNAVYKSVAIEALRIEEAMYGEVYEAMLAAAPKREGGV